MRIIGKVRKEMLINLWHEIHLEYPLKYNSYIQNKIFEKYGFDIDKMNPISFTGFIYYGYLNENQYEELYKDLINLK